jgi:hypothetical protein
MFSGTAQVSHQVGQFFCQFCVSSCACDIVVLAGRLRKLWDSLSELRSSLCERRLERTVLSPALLPVKTTQFTQVFRQLWRHTVKSLSLTESVWGTLRLLFTTHVPKSICVSSMLVQWLDSTNLKPVCALWVVLLEEKDVPFVYCSD